MLYFCCLLLRKLWGIILRSPKGRQLLPPCHPPTRNSQDNQFCSVLLLPIEAVETLQTVVAQQQSVQKKPGQGNAQAHSFWTSKRWLSVHCCMNKVASIFGFGHPKSNIWVLHVFYILHTMYNVQSTLLTTQWIPARWTFNYHQVCNSTSLQPIQMRNASDVTAALPVAARTKQQLTGEWSND